jgi:hypothetical protein
LARAWRFRKRGGRVNLGTGEGRFSRRPDAGGWREDHAPVAHSDSFGGVPTQGLHFVVRRQAGMGEMNMGEYQTLRFESGRIWPEAYYHPAKLPNQVA